MRILVATAFLIIGCGSTSAPGSGSESTSMSDPTSTTGETAAPSDLGVVVGRTDRAAIEAAVPAWRDAIASAAPDAEGVRALSAAPAGARVTIFLGTWCGDSRREVTRFWAALDRAGAVAFEIAYVGVDRAKSAPDGLLDGVDLRRVPTFVVERDGHEVGRVIESAPGGIESDLASLLSGARTGVITGRTDM